MQSIVLPGYLALKEIWRNRGRFFLISLVIALITTLVLFIAALAEGLGAGNREYLSKLHADLIVYQERSDLSIPASRLGRSKLNDIRRVEGVAAAGPIGFSNASLLPGSGQELLKVALVGVEPGQPGEPTAYTGRQFSTDLAREAILDRNVVLRTRIKLGDTIVIKSTQGTEDRFYILRVVGISDGQQYGLQPAVFVPYFTWDRIRPKSGNESSQTELIANIVAVRLKDPAKLPLASQRLVNEVKNIEVTTLRQAYEALPGYSAQQSTLNTQSVFTLLIGLLVIGGFFQIQTLQKVPQIGVLKAIGASSPLVATASVIQIIVVSTLGVILGGGGTGLLALTLPPTLPALFNGQSVAAAIASLLLIGPAGGVVSIRYSVRIEPLKALGLSA